MKTQRLLATILFACVCSTGSYASDHLPRVTMTMTMINQSNDTLTYNGVTDTNPENVFLVSPKVIMPGSTVTITSVSNNYNVPDLSGNVHFQDRSGKNYAVRVNDAKQMHYGNEAHFVMGDEKFIPKLITSNESPLAMTYSSELS
jgi:opacity protein-like surface antigen